MSRKKVRLLKKILGAYLMIIGTLLSINVYEQKPSNMQFIFVFASIMIIVGFLYLIQDIRKALEKAMQEKAEKNAKIQEEERIRRHKELHSSDKFRTAPMPVVKSVKLETSEENLEEFDEKSIIITDYEEENSEDTKKLSIEIEDKVADDENSDEKKTAINVEVSLNSDKEEDAKAEEKEE